MPTIYMTHKDHGSTHVYDFGEKRRLEGFGWKEGTPPTLEEQRALKGLDQEAEAPAPKKRK